MDDLDLGATIKGLSPGLKVFNRYTLVRMVGRGGMGVVWLTRDEELGRDTALKFLPEIIATDRASIEDLKHEVRRAMDLSHPNIVKIHDFVTDGRIAAVSMEYIAGETLSSLRIDEPGQVFSPEKLAPWVAQLCSALAYAHHDAQVVHRDLKPANLMIDARGRLKVLDFGLAASLAESVSRVSRQSTGSGTPAYMSPQQLRGMEATVSDDLYSLGATLYELLTGQPPFNSTQPAVLMHLVMHELPLPINERRAKAGQPPVPDAWERTVHALLAKEPKDRPQSAQEVLERLDITTKGTKVTKPEPVGQDRRAGRDELATQSKPLNQKSKIAAVTVIAALAAAGWYFGVHAPEQRRLEAERLHVEQMGLATERVTQAARQPSLGQAFENSLGMKFVPVPGTGVLFSVWETRVQDFEAFVRETGHDATQGMYSLRSGDEGEHGDTWKSPGFAQGSTHPVVGVNQADAQAFCEWLTKKERAAGRLAPNQEYRLPTDAEWDAAVGRSEFPWGNQWPPPNGAGNYAGAEARDGNWPSDLGTLEGYRDGFARTAPVGSFTANTHGIYDLGGNVWEYVNDRAHGLRGASFLGNGIRGNLASSSRGGLVNRFNGIGFRVVCVVGSVEVAGSANPLVAPSAVASTSTMPVAGQKWTIPDLALDLMPIAPGAFQMGSASSDQNDERPVTRVTLTRPFWLGKTEVTQWQWHAIMGYNPSNFKGDNLPVEQVSYDDALNFCQKLTEQEREAGRLPEGYVYTLPTEAQWEYACRAGTTGDHAGNLDAMGWYRNNSGNSTKPVGTKAGNAWGLYDMHGNVSEWCLDWYGNYPGGSVADPTGPPSGSFRVFRGGAWWFGAAVCRSTFRSRDGADLRSLFLGFRLALSSVR